MSFQRRRALALGLAWCLLSIGVAARPSSARFPADAANSPAVRFGNLGALACLGLLRERGIAFERVSEAPGVLAPVRLKGALGGVLYRTDFPDSERARVPWEVMDCRLVLALHDFSRILRAHDVVEVRIFSAWRPPSKSWSKEQLATRHPGALAADIRLLKKESGSELVVVNDYNGRRGAQSCGERAVAPRPPTAEARELRSIVCEAADARLFNTILTPNYDRRHRNHIHLDVTPGVRWFIVR